MNVFVMSSVHRWDDTRVFHRQASSLAKHHQVQLHAPAPFSYKEMNGVNVHGLPPWTTEIQRVALWCRLLVRAVRSNAEVFHFHDPELLPLGFLLELLGKKVIYDVHEDIYSDILDKQWIPPYLRRGVASFFSLVERLTVPLFDTVIYTTSLVGQRYLKIARKAVSIENYPMLSIFADPEPQRPSLDRHDVIYLGNVFYVRGVEEVIRSWPRVVDVHPQARFVIVGEIVPPAFETHLRTLTAELKMQEHVVFCGHVDYLQTRDYLSRAAVGVVTFLPFKNNLSCLPNKLFEYMASGLAVVASDFPLYREVVQASNCGLLVDPTNTAQVAEAVIRLLSDREGARTMGENGRHAFVQKYNWEQEEHALFAIYDSLSTAAE